MKDFKYYSMNLRQELIKVVAYLYHFKCRFILANTKNDAARTIHYQIKGKIELSIVSFVLNML